MAASPDLLCKGRQLICQPCEGELLNLSLRVLLGLVAQGVASNRRTPSPAADLHGHKRWKEVTSQLHSQGCDVLSAKALLLV